MSNSLISFKNNNILSESFIATSSLFSGNPALFVNNKMYTYSQLREYANDIYLQLLTAKNQKRIGVYCTASVFSYAAILAIGCYGASYVPIHPKFPTARIQEIIDSAGIELIIAEADLNHLQFKNCETKTIAISNQPLKEKMSKSLMPIVEQEECYLLFTSGSTGKSKGVPVSKNNVRAFFNFYLSNYSFQQNDKFLQPYELTFDVSVFSMFMPWMVGACCYVVPENGIKFLNIVKMVKDFKITVASMVPTVLSYIQKYFDQLILPDLKYSFFSGAILYNDLAEKWNKCLPNGEIHNFYGPTETTIVCTRYIWQETLSQKEAYNNIVPIGTCFNGMHFIIINEQNETVNGKETPGELCFHGEQVIQTYLNNIQEESFFVHNNFRYYKTGDIVSLNTNNDIIFHGRKDEQLKVNGYRIEAGEIEARIKQITGENCCVYGHYEGGLVKYLVAVIEGVKDEKNLLQNLKLILPDYMIPKKFFYLSELPFNMNGKVDKLKLKNLLYA